MGSYNREKAWSDFRVGLIAFVGLSFLVLGVTFAGGDKGLLFRKTATVRARLIDVGGLKKGGAVTMGGMTIGKVTDIRFVEDPDQHPIEILVEVRSDVARHIKVDSVAVVRIQGMLGDRYVDISMGSEKAPALSEGQYLRGPAAADFDRTLRETVEVLKETEKVLTAVNQEEGTVGRLVYDGKFYDKLLEITTELNELIKDFKRHPRRYVKFSLF